MLAQSFKSAQDLNLRDDQYTALIKVLHLLETEKLEHIVRSDRHKIPIGQHKFNMSLWELLEAQETHEFVLIPSYEKRECGTIGCIAGTANVLAGTDVFRHYCHDSAPYRETALGRLFFPDIYDFDTITPEHAATALRSYLTTGDVDWSTITGRAFYARNLRNF